MSDSRGDIICMVDTARAFQDGVRNAAMNFPTAVPFQYAAQTDLGEAEREGYIIMSTAIAAEHGQVREH